MNHDPHGGFRLLSYADPATGAHVAGVLVDGHVHSASSLLAGTGIDASSVLSVLQTWPDSHRAIEKAIGYGPLAPGQPLGDTTLLAPVLYPRAIFCAGANYWDHIEEMEGRVDRTSRATDPWFFVKTAAHSVVGDGAVVSPPSRSRQLDWEAELAVVIGSTARDVPATRAAEVIAGFTIINDLSARDLMTRSDRPPSMTYDWVGQKCFDGAAPMGPWITPADQLPDWHDLTVRLWVNDVLKQDSTTANLIHGVEEQVEWLSGQLTLMPGDVIATGTPAGVGLPRSEFLNSGDVVRIEVEGCGSLITLIGN